MSGHTPGPWRAEASGGAITTQIAGRDRQVALACGEAPQHEPETCGPAHEIQAANARLIAAAPDLLSACLAMSECCGSAENWQGETNAALLLIEAAIAKAEGRS